MGSYLKKCEGIILKVIGLVKQSYPLALALLLLKLLLMKELSAAFATLYVVIILVVGLYVLLDKAYQYKAEEKKKDPEELAKVSHDLQQVKSVVDSLTLRYGFESRIP